MNIFLRSAQGLPLTQFERGFLRALKTLVVNGFIAVIPLIMPLLQTLSTGKFNFNWTVELSAISLAFLSSVLQGVLHAITSSQTSVMPQLGVMAGTIPTTSLQQAPQPDPSQEPNLTVVK